jgi:polyisoprenoid-binding protein YceI
MSPNSSPPTVLITGYRPGTWKVDPAHSAIAFSVRQLLITPVTGRFTAFDITIVTADDPLDSSVAATIELASLDTGNEKRDEHVRSETFLDVANHPTATYRSTGIRRSGDGWIVDGELTLHGITHEVALDVAVVGFEPEPDGGRRAGFSATGRIRRGEFGIDRWTGGGLVVSDRVLISLDIEAVLER